jgi:hypothetical protein
MRKIFFALIAIFSINISLLHASEYESLASVERQIVQLKINAEGSSEET